MKGLLIKDFRLMKTQIRMFLIFIAIAVAMAISADDTSFMIGFITFVFSLFTLSTISYDEFDNGNAFLFTLPIRLYCGEVLSFPNSGRWRMDFLNDTSTCLRNF